MASIMPPPATAVARRNERRSISVGAMTPSSPFRCDDHGRDLVSRVRRVVGRAMDGFANARVRRTAAKIPAHCEIDVSIRRPCIPAQHCGSRHDLSRLTVAALRYVELLPRALQRMRAVGRETL